MAAATRAHIGTHETKNGRINLIQCVHTPIHITYTYILSRLYVTQCYRNRIYVIACTRTTQCRVCVCVCACGQLTLYFPANSVQFSVHN